MEIKEDDLKTHPFLNREIGFGQESFRSRTWGDCVKDIKLRNWVLQQAHPGDQLKEIKEFILSMLKPASSEADHEGVINEGTKGAYVNEAMKINDNKPFTFFKVIDQDEEDVNNIKETLKMIGAISQPGASTHSFNCISKELTTAILYKAHASKSIVFKKY